MTIESNQFLSFILDQETFAIDIESVKEILEMKQLTRLPHTPEAMLGVINLRGHAVPVFDLRTTFHLQQQDDTVNTSIIILDITLDGKEITLGARVDSVQEVWEIPPESIEPVPAMGLNIDNTFVKGMGRKGENFVIILDCIKIFTTDELHAEYAA